MTFSLLFPSHYLSSLSQDQVNGETFVPPLAPAGAAVWHSNPSEGLSKCISIKCHPDVCWVKGWEHIRQSSPVSPTLKVFNPHGKVWLHCSTSGHTLALTPLCINSFNPHAVGQAWETAVHRPLRTGQAGGRAHSFPFSLPTPIYALFVYLFFAHWGGFG